jgi:hypothetical protein
VSSYTPGTARIAFPEGVLVTSSDLRAEDAYLGLARRRHIRAVHWTWGVALGFELVRSWTAREVVVGPGLAYDCHGREILSARTVVLSPAEPPVRSQEEWWLDLLVSYNSDLRDPRDREPCLGEGPGPREERPAWRWSYTGPSRPYGRRPALGRDVRRGEEVPLCRFRRTTDGRLLDPDLSVRPVVERLANPHVAAGRIEQGAVAISGTPAAWSVEVDTSEAGFLEPPLYTAVLERYPLFEGSLHAGIGESALQAPYGESEAGFTLNVRFALRDEVPAELLRRGGGVLPVPIAWIGIEPSPRCRAPLDLPGLIDAGGEPSPLRAFKHLFDLPRSVPA